MNILRFAICTLAFVLAPAVAWSVDLTPSQDNTIFQNSTTLSAGGQIGIFVGANAMSMLEMARVLKARLGDSARKVPSRVS